MLVGQLVRGFESEDKQLAFHVTGKKEQVARPCKGWLQQQARKMISAETFQMDVSRRKLPCQDKRKRCFVILT